MLQGSGFGTIDSSMQRRFLLPLGLVIVALIIGIFFVPRGGATPALYGGAVFTQLHAAPNFALHDQYGRRVSPRDFRGHVVAVTFLEARCRELCPLVAEELRAAAAGLRRDGASLTVLAISTDPKGDTPAAVATFLHDHRAGPQWHYLTGSRTALEPVWRSYYVYSAPPFAPASVRDAHTSATYLLDTQGRERVELGEVPDPATLSRDLRILAGLDVGVSAGVSLAAPQPGLPAPGFKLRTLPGQAVSLSSFRGKTVVLNFWSTTCPPCRRETGILDAAFKRLHARGVVVLGVDKQEDPSAVRAFVRQQRITYPILMDTDGSVMGRYLLRYLPDSFVIDARGVVAARRVGTVDPAWLTAQIQPLFSVARATHA